jgi:hypothetical protein
MQNTILALGLMVGAICCALVALNMRAMPGPLIMGGFAILFGALFVRAALAASARPDARDRL